MDLRDISLLAVYVFYLYAWSNAFCHSLFLSSCTPLFSHKEFSISRVRIFCNMIFYHNELGPYNRYQSHQVFLFLHSVYIFFYLFFVMHEVLFHMLCFLIIVLDRARWKGRDTTCTFLFCIRHRYGKHRSMQNYLLVKFSNKLYIFYF